MTSHGSVSSLPKETHDPTARPRTKEHVDYSDIIALFKAFRETVAEVKKNAVKAPSLITVVGTSNQTTPFGSSTPAASPTALSSTHGSSAPVGPKQGSSASTPRISPNNTQTTVPPSALTVTDGSLPLPPPDLSPVRTFVPPQPIRTGSDDGDDHPLLPPPLLKSSTGEFKEGSAADGQHGSDMGTPQASAAASSPSVSPPAASTATAVPSASPVFFSSGAGTNMGSPVRITLQQALQGLRGFLRDVPTLQGRSTDEVRTRINMLSTEPMRKIARAIYEERDAVDFRRLSSALSCFCEYALYACAEEHPRNSKANLKFFSSGGGTTLSATSPLVPTLIRPPSMAATPPLGHQPSNPIPRALAPTFEEPTADYIPNAAEDDDDDSEDDSGFIASPRLDMTRLPSGGSQFASARPSPPPTPSTFPPSSSRAFKSVAATATGVDLNATVTSTPLVSATEMEQLLSDLLLKDDFLPDQETVIRVVGMARDVLAEETSLVSVPAPCIVVGDIHGQLADLRRILATCGPIGETTYLFLGDYVDRGTASVQCMLILSLAKALYPERIYLLRGNHESKNINSVYGFLAEIEKKYPRLVNGRPVSPGVFDLYTAATTNNRLFLKFNEMFRALPLAAIVDNSIFCVHGGLSRYIDSVEGILCVDRFRDIDDGALADLTWSDPAKIKNFQNNWRGSGCQFGADVTLDFVRRNNLRFVCRAHQCVKEGYQWSHGNRLVTVFSATNYCGLGNNAAIMRVFPTISNCLHASDASEFMSPREEREGEKKDADDVGEASSDEKGADEDVSGENGVVVEVTGGVEESQEPFDGIRFEILPILVEQPAETPQPNPSNLPSHFTS